MFRRRAAFIRPASGRVMQSLKFSRRKPEMSRQTETVLDRHLRAAAVGVDAVMVDYVDSSVLITHDATYRGRAEIRGFFSALLNGSYRGFLGSFKMIRREIVDDVAYILWEASPWFDRATDTFVIRDGKILLQTFSACQRRT
jgi:hypothetical protein